MTASPVVKKWAVMSGRWGGPHNYTGPVPKDYDLIDLPACQIMVFQGPPFEDEADNLWESWCCEWNAHMLKKFL